MSTVDGGPRLLGGRYELRERIATGGMGEVWCGRDVVLQRTVAVKVLRSEYADDPTFVARFRAEARNAAALNHPNIARVLDYGEAPEEQAGEHLAYLVMELVEGAPLSARLAADGPMEPHAALSVLQQTAAALAEAHRRGLVHRDVKPANILVRPDGAVKLTDFGIARSADSVPLTGTGQVVGTAQYMSPEQAKGEPATPASDVYALGLVGYESLTGHAAFEGTNPVTVALQHVVADPQPLPAGLPQQVRGLIDSALAKDPGQRIPDGAAFLDAVQETIGDGTDGDPVSDTRPARVVAGGSPVPADGATRVPADGPPARRRALAVLLPLLVLCALAGALLLVVGPGSGDGDDTAAGPSVAVDPGIVLTADDHVGRPYEDVAGQLEALGLAVVRSEQVTADRPAGTVTAIGPTDVRLDAGDEVRVTVAVAPAEEDLPQVPETTGGSVGGASVPAGEAPADAPTGTAPGAGTGEGTTATSPEPSSPEPTSPEPSSPEPTSPEPTSPEPTSPEPTSPEPTSPEPTSPTEPTAPTGPTEPTEPTGGTAEPPAAG